MRWRGRRGSGNIEDRRGASAWPRGGLPGGFRIPMGRRGGGIGRGTGLGGIGVVILLAILLLAGVDPRALLQGEPVQMEEQAGPVPRSPGEDEAAQFVSVVLADTEDAWNALFPDRLGRDYQEPTLVLFSGAVRSACGFAQSATGPFYCPSDQKVYLDLAFFEELGRRFGAPGDFAQAYVVAHEVGHHVQTLLGITTRVHALRGELSEADYNQLSVRLELQADCLAGVWAHHAERSKDILEAGDVEEALNAASAIGDDRIQQRTQGQVVPESFTHGSSAQRAHWFREGLESGAVDRCNTFEADAL